MSEDKNKPNKLDEVALQDNEKPVVTIHRTEVTVSVQQPVVTGVEYKKSD